jgi:hypothetical protein
MLLSVNILIYPGSTSMTGSKNLRLILEFEIILLNQKNSPLYQTVLDSEEWVVNIGWHLLTLSELFIEKMSIFLQVYDSLIQD